MLLNQQYQAIELGPRYIYWPREETRREAKCKIFIPGQASRVWSLPCLALTLLDLTM